MMMLDPSLVEYIVVHELAHLSVMNHSADFWNLVVQVLPDAQQRRHRLREAGKALPL
jgi:predicted metal-dependent hydrolase